MNFNGTDRVLSYKVGYVLSLIDVKNVVVRLAVDVGNDLLLLTFNYRKSVIH